MKRTNALITIVIAATLSAGCLPEKRIVWSPDGSRAAVAAADGLYLIDAEGNVLEPRLLGSSARCAWFPDGRRLAVVQQKKVASWADVGELIGMEQPDEIRKIAEALRPRIMAFEGNWDDFEIDRENIVPPSIEIAALLYVRDNLGEGLPEKLGDKWDDLKKLEITVHQMQVFTLTEEAFKPGKILLRTFSEMISPRVAPDGANIAVLTPTSGGDDDAPALGVVSASGGELRKVAGFVGYDYDWSPDGSNLAYIHTTSTPGDDEDQVRLGSLTTIKVCDPKGALLEEFEQRKDRVGLLFNPLLGVRWLTDGRLLFSTVELSLPATTSDMPRRWSLFVLDPRMPATVLRVLARDFDEPLEESIPLFAVSPDETRVVLLGPGGQVVLYSFATGEAKTLMKIEDGGDWKCLPTWRNNSEICFLKPAAEEGSDTEVVLWKEGKMRTISGKWPEEMKKDWLKK